MTIFPDNLAAGARRASPAFVNRQGLIEGREMRRLGVDLSFGPVLDVLTERYSPNIGIRSYGKDPALVVALRRGAHQGHAGGRRVRLRQALSRARAMRRSTPISGLPVIDSDWADMHAGAPLPFMAAMEAGVDCLMTSHPLYPNLDPEPRTPATFSRLIVDDYLRGQVGYRGVVASDDLEMGAIAELCPVGEATVRAAAAGHDLLLVCHTEAAQRAAHQALLAAYRSRALPVRCSRERLAPRRARARRAAPLRRRACAPFAGWRAARQGHRRARRHRRDAAARRACGAA